MNACVKLGIRLGATTLASALACILVGASALGQGIGASWEGITRTGFVPPDVHGAPGPKGIMATVNLSIQYFNKSGGTIWGPVGLQSFWSSVGNSGGGLSDPKVVFDHGSRRFFVIMQENNAGHYYLNVAASKSFDPHGSGTSDWFFYRFDATESSGGLPNSAGGFNYGGDYPGLAVDGQALYCTHRMYAFNPDGSLNGCGCNWNNTGIEIMNKNNLLSGSGTLSVVYVSGFHVQPVTPFNWNPGNVMYAAGNWNNNTIVIYAVSDPLGTRTLSTQFLSMTDRGGGPSTGAPQFGSANTIDPIIRTLDNACLVGGDVWFCRTAGVSAGPAVACYHRLRLNGWPSSSSVSTVEDSTVGDSSYWNFCPAICVNQAGEAVMTWTRSSSSTYATMMYAYRGASDSSFGSPQVVKASGAANNDGRWGDYATVWPDPNDGSLWIANEWTRADTGTWSTWWAQVLTPAYDFYVQWNAPFPIIQNGTLAFPYVTVQAAHANITHGTIHIFGGANYNEQFTLYKNVTLQEYNNPPITIGRP